MIGVLIVAHDTLGESLVKAVTHVLGARPAQFALYTHRHLGDGSDLPGISAGIAGAGLDE